MPLTLPYTIGQPTKDILSSPLQSNFQAIVSKFSGGIVDADIATGAGISGAKVAQNTLPGDRIASGTITNLQMGNNSVNTDQLVALAVTKDKLTVTAGQKITTTQLEITVTALTPTQSTALPLAVTTAVVGGVSSWAVLNRYVQSYSSTFGPIYAGETLSPAAAVPSATTTVIGVYMGTGGALGIIYLVTMANS